MISVMKLGYLYMLNSLLLLLSFLTFKGMYKLCKRCHLNLYLSMNSLTKFSPNFSGEQNKPIF